MPVKSMRTKKSKKKIWISLLSFMAKWRESFGKIPRVVSWLQSDQSVAKYGSQQQAEKLKLCNKSVQQCTWGTQLTRKQCSQAWIKPACSAGQFLCHSSHSSLFGKLVIEECICFLSFQYLLCCLIHLINRIKKLPHEHPQSNYQLRKAEAELKLLIIKNEY